MSQFESINEFNVYFSNQLRNFKLGEYFNQIHLNFYSNLDISFMNYFLELTNYENEFIVEHQKLKEYGIINNMKSSTILQTLINTALLIENEDYRVHNIMHPVKQGGFSIKKQYKLTPYAFKLCLIRSKNSKTYAKYYLLLEQVFKNYQDYQILYQNVLLSGKDEKIDEQSKDIKEMKNTINKQSEEIKELLKYAKDTKEEVQDLKEEVENLNDSMEDIKEGFKETAERSVPNPSDENERHEFILLQHKELNYKFTFIRGIQKLNENKVSRKYKEYNIIKREYNANPIQLFKQFKESMKEYYAIEKEKIKNDKKLKNKTQLKKEVEKIKFCGNNLELQFNYTLNDLMDDLTKVCNEKFNEYNNYSESP